MQTAERKKNKVKRMEEGNKEENFYPQFYKKLYQWYEKHLWAVRTVNVLYHLLPALAVLCYVDLLGLVYINGGRIMLLKVILVPFITFGVYRLCKAHVRTVYDGTAQIPIVTKDKTGESMPSRHTASFISHCNDMSASIHSGVLCLFVA